MAAFWAGATGLALGLGSCGGDSEELFSGGGVAGLGEDASAGASGADASPATGGKGGFSGAGGAGGSVFGGAGGGGSGVGGGATGGSATGGSAGAGEPCVSSSECVQKHGSDACKVNITCNPETAACAWSVLDKDQDGQPPLVCGGQDCNDNDPSVSHGQAEQCDGKDNDCDGAVDEAVQCGGLLQCLNGVCACPASNACGSECVDKSTSMSHCGQCFNACSTGASCVAGVCKCAAGSLLCGTVCVNPDSDPKNCGACGAVCAPGYSCVNKTCMCTQTACFGTCVDIKADPNHCGGCGVKCPPGSTCQNGACVCGGGLSLCSGACVDTSSSSQHCGACNHPCSGACKSGVCVGCVQSDLYLLVDTTGSMAPPDAGVTGRLEMVRQGVSAFLSQSATAGMGVGMGYFPKPAAASSNCANDSQCGCGGSCFIGFCFVPGDSGEVSDYSSPTVAIGLVPGVNSTLNNSMNSLTTGGGTPPAPLAGALAHSKAFAQANMGHKVAVVLLADGLPNECTSNPNKATDWLGPASQAATGTPQVLTYVVSLGDASMTPEFNAVAAAGGTGSARVASSAIGVRLALEAIRTEFKTCP
jgi:hypothetical protein